MPLYDATCAACGFGGEVWVALADYDARGVRCPDCGEWARRVIHPVPTVGPMPSKPIRVAGGPEFTSKGAFEQWRQTDGQGAQPLSSTEIAELKYRAEHRANAEARRNGYRDLDDFKVKAAAADKEGKPPPHAGTRTKSERQPVKTPTIIKPST
jgi:putative FmdB family regulatory protein